MKRLGLVLLMVMIALAGLTFRPANAADPVKVTLQLQWVDQAQFAGYYAAIEQGYYTDMGLDVTILPGGPDINAVQVVAGGQAQIGNSWLPRVLVAREEGAKLVNIAQVFTRSGMLHVSFKDKNITKAADLKNKKVAVWTGGLEAELFAALVKNGIDPNDASQVEVVSQPFDMSLLLNGEVDAAAAMTYNEYAQVLETINPATGKLYTPEELNVIDYNVEGTAMLQDGLFVSEEWLAGNEETATKFLAASFKGWAYCRDNATECVKYVLARGSALGESHQTWQMNEISKLIWPNEAGIGVMDEAAFTQTATIAKTYGIIKADPVDAYRADLAKKALEMLGADFDAVGKDYKPITVELKEGGK
jgi:NitT/TauT family transport system substrate-binding protein